MPHRVLQNVGGCRPFLTSAYAAAVLTDSPVAYWEYQDCSGFPVDSSGSGLNMNAVTSTSGLIYRRPGALTDPRDLSIEQAGGSTFTRSAPVSTVTNNFTIEMWVKVAAVTFTNQALVYNGIGSTDGWGLMIDTDFKLLYLAGGVAFGGKNTTALTVNTWAHIAVTRNTTWTYYVNGSPDGTGGTTTPNVPATRVQVGDGAVQRFQSHIAIYNTALSAARIAAHYAAR